MQNMLEKLKKAGVDIGASEYTDNQSAEYIDEVRLFIKSLDFMRLGQAIKRQQWQAAAMKAGKMSQMSNRLGFVRFERPFTGIRQNINRKNENEALQALATIITLRVKIMELLNEN